MTSIRSCVAPVRPNVEPDGRAKQLTDMETCWDLALAGFVARGLLISIQAVVA